MKKKKMNTKNLLVSLCIFTMALLLVAPISAYNYNDTTEDDVAVCGENFWIKNIKVDNVNIDEASVVEGEEISVQVKFHSHIEDSEVTVEVELDAKKDVEASTEVFTVLPETTTKKTLTLKVPIELKDELSDYFDLTVKVDGNTINCEKTKELLVRRATYKADVKSITTPSSISAGDTFPIEVVLKNMGYNDLDDVYASARIVGLDVSQGPKWFGDIVVFESNSHHDDNDDEDTVVGKFYLKVPYDVTEGIYNLEVTVTNDDTETTEVRQITIKNDFTENIIVTSTKKTTAVGEQAVYELLIVNPTDNVKVYRIVTDGNVLTASQSVVAVPAGSSKTVKVAGSTEEEGEYTFDVNIFDGETLIKTVTLELDVEGSSTNTIVVLTVVLAIIFLVLLVVLIVLLGKKPEKAEDFGESYY